MRIRLFTLSAGPGGVRQPGAHDVPEAEALALIKAGHAESIERKPVITTFTPPRVETANHKPRKERRG